MGLTISVYLGETKFTTTIITITTTLGIGISAYLVWYVMNKKLTELISELKQTQFSLRSAYVKFGKSFEHFVPFIKNFPGDVEKTQFLGMPIDFISFDKDKIRFIEVKTGSSQLNPNQKRVKKLIDEKKVEFLEVRYDGTKYN